MFGGIIEKRVMTVIKAKIAAKQKEYDEGVVKIDEEAQIKKEKLADATVDSILNKIL